MLDAEYDRKHDPGAAHDVPAADAMRRRLARAPIADRPSLPAPCVLWGAAEAHPVRCVRKPSHLVVQISLPVIRTESYLRTHNVRKIHPVAINPNVGVIA